MPTNARQVKQYSLEKFWGGRLDGVSGTLVFSVERGFSFMLVTMLLSVAGVNRTLLRRLLGGWAFALAFRRGVFASLDVSYTAATTLPPSRRCRLIEALFDELQLVTGLAQFVGDKTCEQDPAKSSTLRTLRRAWAAAWRLYAREDWLAFYELAAEKGDHVRLDWKGRAACTMHVQPLHHLL